MDLAVELTFVKRFSNSSQLHTVLRACRLRQRLPRRVKHCATQTDFRRSQNNAQRTNVQFLLGWTTNAVTL